MPRFSDEAAIRAIQESRGLLSVAARSLGCSRQALYKRKAKSSRVQAALDEARELTGDLAEAKLYEAINNGEGWAIKFYLTCQAKDRGYVEKLQLGGTLSFDVRQLSDDELLSQLATAQERMRPPAAARFNGNGNDGERADLGS